MAFISHLGQLLIGSLFILAAITDLLDYKALLQLLERKKIPYAEILLPGAIFLKITGGLALLLNFLVPLAAFLLAGFVLIANIIFHNFWSHTGFDRKREYMQFLVHMIVVGGLLVLVGH